MYVVDLYSPETTDREKIGGKAENLCILAMNGYKIPRGFCITTDAFVNSIRKLFKGKPQAKDIKEAFLYLEIPSEIVSEIEKGYARLLKQGVSDFVVRSSSVVEDGIKHSWAGQQDTYINIRGFSNILKYIKLCWASMFNETTLLYAAQNFNKIKNFKTAVIVQEMINSEIAGVSFSINPLSGKKNEILHTSTYGLAKTVVDGGTSDVFVVDKNSFQIVEKIIGFKKEIRIPNGTNGTITKMVPESLAKKSSLNDTLIKSLTHSVVGIERVFGSPQDVEWAVKDGEIFFLQARAITAGKGFNRTKTQQEVVFTNANVGEALPGVATPFTWSIIGNFADLGFKYAFSSLGLSYTKKNLIGNFWGRIYLNATEFVEILSEIPFLSPEKLVELGGGGGLELFPEKPKNNFGKNIKFLVKSPLIAATVLWNQIFTPLYFKVWKKRFKKLVDEFYSIDFSSLPKDKIRKKIKWFTEEIFNKNGSLLFRSASNSLTGFVFLSLIFTIFCGKEGEVYTKKLLSGISNLKSAEPGLFLLRLARIVKNHKALNELFSTRKSKEVLSEINNNPEFANFKREFFIFLKNYGYRAPREAEISTPRWEDEPEKIVDIIKNYIKIGEPPDPIKFMKDRVRQRFYTEEKIKSKLGIISWFILNIVPFVRQMARLREELRDMVVKTIAMYRHLALESGKIMKKEGVLGEVSDVFFLSYDEILDYFEESGTLDIPLKVALRKSEFEIYKKMPDPPDSFLLRNGEIVKSSEHPPIESKGGKILKGIGGSPGRHTGRAKILTSPDEIGKLEFGDVLVTSYTDTGWTPLFLIAGAVVTELGGPLSHSCIVAREYGKPAVLNVKNATRKIKENSVVTVDGDSGEIIIH